MTGAFCSQLSLNFGYRLSNSPRFPPLHARLFPLAPSAAFSSLHSETMLSPAPPHFAPRRLACIAALILIFALAVTGLALAADTQERFAVATSLDQFSPNGDGIQDAILISTINTPDDIEEPYDWQCRIRDSSGKIIRMIQADRRLRRPSRGPTNLWLPRATSTEPVEMFESLFWDGRDAEGRIVTDGTYQIEVGVQIAEGDLFIEAVPARVIAHTIAPIVELKPVVGLFVLPPGSGPPGRSARERLELRQTVRAGSGTRYSAALLNQARSMLQERAWSDSLPPSIYIYWDDLAASGSAPYGIYTYQLRARDAAGNQGFAESSELIFESEPAAFDLRAERYHFSPNGDGARDRLRLDLISLDANGLARGRSGVGAGASWQWLVAQSPVDAPVLRREGNGAAPEFFEFAGVDDSDAPLADGLYFTRFEANVNGLRKSSPWRPVWIDRSGPALDLSIARATLADESEQDPTPARLRFTPADPSGIELWAVRIYAVPDPDKEDSPRFLYRSFGGRASPEDIDWNGVSDRGYAPESLEAFEIEVEAADRAGNVSLSRGRYITSEALLRPEKNGSVNLRMSFPDRGYFDEEDKLTSAGKRVLSEALSRLSRYPQYRVSIESHAALPGREETNLQRSERRAWNMFEYMQKNGFPRERLEYRGCGESEIRIYGDDPFAHYRNERIELRLRIPANRENLEP